MKNETRSRIQKELYRLFPYCWGCGEKYETEHHSPPKALRPKMYIKIPMCKKCHRKINGIEYSGTAQRSLKSNVKKIEKSIRNIRLKVLDKE